MDMQTAKTMHLRGGLRRIPRVENPAAAFMDLAWDEDWMLRSRVLEDRDAGTSYELVLEDIERGSWIDYVEDLLVDVPYVTTYGPEQEALARVVADALNAWSDEELLKAWDRARSLDEAARAVLLLGVAAPPRYSEPFFTRIKAGLEHADADIRNAAVVAIGYRGWAAFHPILVALQTSDPDEILRQRCQLILANWAEHAEEAAADV